MRIPSSMVLTVSGGGKERLALGPRVQDCVRGDSCPVLGGRCSGSGCGLGPLGAFRAVRRNHIEPMAAEECVV